MSTTVTQAANPSGNVVTTTTDPVTGGIELSTEKSGIDNATLLQRCAFDVVKGLGTPTYVGTELSNGGDFGRRLVQYTGDLANPTITAIANAQVLTPAGGGAALGTNVGIHGAKVLSDGAVLFHVFDSTTSKNWLYLTNTARTSVGSGAGRSNGQAVLNVGERSGTHYADVRTTHARSIGETFSTDGTRYVWLAEYNVAAGRTAGSANDFVRVMRSSDGGLTWTTFIEMNTTVSQHYSDHMHGVVQNPYTGTIYFMSGDDKVSGYDERWILAWDGISAAPALGSGPDVFKVTAGWKVLQGSELYRTVDMLFAPTGHAFWLCDCDTQAYDTTSNAFAAMVADPLLQWASRVETIDRIDNIPPCIGVRTASGISVFASFHNASPTSNEVWVWTSGNDGKHWKLAAKLTNYTANSTIGVPWNLFEDPYTGKVMLAAPYAKGLQFTSAATSGYTYVFDVSRIGSDVRTWG